MCMCVIIRRLGYNSDDDEIEGMLKDTTLISDNATTTTTDHHDNQVIHVT